MSKLGIQDESYCPLSESVSTSTSGAADRSPSKTDLSLRFKLNVFLEEANLESIKKPFIEWDKASKKTQQRYEQRSAEIVTAVLKVIYPGAASQLWNALKESKTINSLLEIDPEDETSQPTNKYLEALAESYKNAKSWDTRRQILSVMAGIASYKEVLRYIPGLSQYRYSIANLHRKQFGRGAPVPKETSPRMRIDTQQLDHFLGFITSPHLVQDLPFGVVKLKLSSGKMISVPNVIRTMVPQRIVNQYKMYCDESCFKPLSERTLLRILTECSASVRKSLQGLDNFAAEGGQAFEDLSALLERMLSFGANEREVSKLRETLKAGKLYLKGDFKVSALPKNMRKANYENRLIV